MNGGPDDLATVNPFVLQSPKTRNSGETGESCVYGFCL